MVIQQRDGGREMCSALRTQHSWAPAGPRDQAALAPAARRVRCRAMQRPPSVRTLTIPFADLRERDKDLSSKIEEGLGPHGLGIVSIADVPDFPGLRKRLLRLAPRIVNLPEDVKKQLEDPDSRYNFGCCHGKEKLESGKLGKMFEHEIYGQLIIFLSLK